MKRILLASLFVLAGCQLRGIRVTASPTVLTAREREEAIGLIQGDTGKGVFIADGEIEKVALALRTVRLAFPDGNDITVRAGSGLEIILTDSAARFMQTQFPTGWRGDTVLSTLGIASIDSLHAELGISRIVVHVVDFISRPRWFLVPHWPRPIYRSEAANRYQRLAAVHLAAYGLMLGDGGGLNLARTATGYQFGFSRKWGDCPAGCINEHHWVFQLDVRTNRVTKIRDDGDPWPIPPAA